MAITSSLWFLEKADLYRTTKPYKLMFHPTDDSFPVTNLSHNEIHDIEIRDLREVRLDICDFDLIGITVVKLPTQISLSDRGDPSMLYNAYFNPLNAQLKRIFGCDHVETLSYQFRKREDSFPVSTGRHFPNKQPARAAHIDFTPGMISLVVKSKFGEEAERILGGRYLCVNAWKPLNGPVNDWPLAICDASSVDEKNDLEKAEAVFANTIDENYQVYYNSAHKWFYLSEQKNSEVLIFRVFDSRAEGRPGVPHAAFQPSKPAANRVPRESVEANIFLWWN